MMSRSFGSVFVCFIFFFLCLFECLIIFFFWKLDILCRAVDTEVIVLCLRIVTAFLLLGFWFSFINLAQELGCIWDLFLPWFPSMQHSLLIYRDLYLGWLVLYQSKIHLILNFRFPFVLWLRDSMLFFSCPPSSMVCHCNSNHLGWWWCGGK